MNIYVGNVSRDVTESDLRAEFEAYGQVESADIIKDKATGQSRGFAFVVMPDDTAARTAIEELNGKDLKGRTINVSESRPKPEGGGGGRRPGGGGGGRGYGGPRGGGGGGGRREGGGGGGYRGR